METQKDLLQEALELSRKYPDLWQAVRTKHEYNKTRPYKHGGKKC